MQIILLILSVFIFFSSCATGFRTKTLVYSTANTAYYILKREEIANRVHIEGNFKHPYKMSPQKLKDILGNIKFNKTTRINQYVDHIYHEKELDNLTLDLSQTLENLDKEHVAVIISQYDHLNSVISNYKRTSCMVWINEAGLNVVFGDIQNDVSREKSYNFYDWTQIEPISLEERPDENRIQHKPEFFNFKKVKGYLNRKWLVFSLSDLEKYKFEERPIDKRPHSDN